MRLQNVSPFGPQLFRNPGETAAAGLLLDAYPNAIAAYSMRKLRAAYGGSAVRIRRSSDNAEADIGFSGNDFDSAAAATHIGGGSGFITTWYDQSGVGVDLTQATAGIQPPYLASGIDSKPSISWTNTVTKLRALNVACGGTNTASCFAVLTMNAGTASFGAFAGAHAASTLSHTNDNGFAFAVRPGAVSTLVCAVISDFANGIINISYDTDMAVAYLITGTSRDMYKNGASSGDPTAYSTFDFGGDASDTTDLEVGGVNTGAGAGSWTGYSTEFILYSSDQTANLAGINTSQATYWNI